MVCLQTPLHYWSHYTFMTASPATQSSGCSFLPTSPASVDIYMDIYIYIYIEIQLSLILFSSKKVGLSQNIMLPPPCVTMMILGVRVWIPLLPNTASHWFQRTRLWSHLTTSPSLSHSQNHVHWQTLTGLDTCLLDLTGAYFLHWLMCFTVFLL